MEMSAFLAKTLLRGVGLPQDEPKADKKIVFRSRVPPNNYMEGLFRTVTSYFVLHCNFWAE